MEEGGKVQRKKQVNPELLSRSNLIVWDAEDA